MNSQINNKNENQEVISEDQFRPVFFDSGKRVCQQTLTELNKRARLDVPTVPSPDATSAEKSSSDKEVSVGEVATVVVAAAAADKAVNCRERERRSSSRHSRRSRSRSLPNIIFSHRRYRSQPVAVLNNLSLLPTPTATSTTITADTTSSNGNINNSSRFQTTSQRDRQQGIQKLSKASASYPKRHHRHHRLHNNLSFNGSESNPVLLPPVNTLSLREIDLHEILKNPQLRHDILFDPQLQFRPNLDGERGKRKRQVVDKYWSEVEEECKEYMKVSTKLLASTAGSTAPANLSKYHLKYSKLPRLFSTLRDILITLLPLKDRPAVYDVMDVDLLVQQLRKGVVDFVSLSKWLAGVFKSHCAPMRDAWVDEMTDKFIEADRENSIKKLIDALRTIFSILEAMKLDVANHQIRVLRPALVETAVDFERDYFNQMIQRGNLNIQDSLMWFAGASQAQAKKEDAKGTDLINSQPNFLRNTSVQAIIKLLSCREMASEFPSSLAFDHLRLILLRADVRQLVCLQICLYLYKQLTATYNKDPVKKAKLLSKAALNEVKREILAVITDENGNVKWTRNIPSITVQLAKRAVMEQDSVAPPPESVVNFAHSWLLKQTQPRSDVYGLMEERIFKQLRTLVVTSLDENKSGTILPQDIPKTATGNSLSTSPSTPTVPTPVTTTAPGFPSLAQAGQLSEEISSLASRLSILTNFHWSVFGSHYSDAIKDIEKQLK